jgi:hypothetical protein
MSIDPDTHYSNVKNSRGEKHLVATCKFCKSSGNCDILLKSVTEYTSIDAERFKTIVALECRGLDPIEWVLSPGWCCKVADGSAVFTDIDFSQGEDWCEYDENTQSSLMISETSTKITK